MDRVLCTCYVSYQVLPSDSSSCHCHYIVKTVKYRITDSWKPISVVDGFISSMAEDSKSIANIV